MASITKYHAKHIRPLRDRILVADMEFSERLSSGGIIIPSDDTKSTGIRPRWGRVFAVGPEQHDVAVGEYVLVAHGRWTRGVTMDVNGEDVVLRMIDNNDILLVSNEPQVDETWSTAVVGQSDRRIIDGSLHNDGTQRD
jgi:co-chaperonin GroES (HSP10)